MPYHSFLKIIKTFAATVNVDEAGDMQHYEDIAKGDPRKADFPPAGATS